MKNSPRPQNEHGNDETPVPGLVVVDSSKANGSCDDDARCSSNVWCQPGDDHWLKNAAVHSPGTQHDVKTSQEKGSVAPHDGRQQQGTGAEQVLQWAHDAQTPQAHDVANPCCAHTPQAHGEEKSCDVSTPLHHGGDENNAHSSSVKECHLH